MKCGINLNLLCSIVYPNTSQEVQHVLLMLRTLIYKKNIEYGIVGFLQE